MIGKGVSFTVLIWTLTCVGVLEFAVDELGQSETGCRLPPVKEGEPATLTCMFKTNISTVGSVSVKAYDLQFEGSGPDGDHVVLMLDPNREPQNPDVVSPHFLFGNVSKNPDGIHWNIYIRIPNATQSFEGDYQCGELRQIIPQSQRCSFILDRIKAHILNATSVLLYVDLTGLSEDRRNKYVFRRIVGKLQGAENVTKNIPPETAQTNFTLTGLKNNAEYEVSVYQGPQEIKLIHKVCIPAISNLRVSYTNNSSVLLRWSSSVCDHSLVNYFYEVCYKVSSKGSQDDTCFNNSAMSSANIRDPERGTKYDIHVKVHVDGTSIGEVSLLNTVLMKTAPPPPEKPAEGIGGGLLAVIICVMVLTVAVTVAVAAFPIISCYKCWSKRPNKDEGKGQLDGVLMPERNRENNKQGNQKSSTEAGPVDEKKALLAKPENLEDPDPQTNNLSRSSPKQTLVPVDMHDQDVVTRSNTRVTTSSGASGEPPQSTPGISTASLTAGQVSADVHDNSEGTDTRAKGDNLNSPPVRNNAPKTAGQGNNEKDMTLPLQQQDSLNKDVFVDTPDSGQPQSPNSCGALAESLTADQIQAIEEAGGEMSGRGRKKSGEGELKLLEQQVKNLKREVQQKEQAKTDLSAHHQELISVLIKSADKMEQELRNQLNEKEKEKNCYERKTAEKEKELDKTKVALQEAENKRLRDLAEAKQLYDKGKVKLKEVNKAREADNQHYKDIINDKELEIEVLKRKNARLSKVICELKRLMEGNTCRPDKNFSGQQHYEEDHHRRASFDDSDDADDTPDVSLARMRLSVLPNATSTPELSRPTEVNSPVKDSHPALGNTRPLSTLNSTSNVDAPTDSTSNVDAPTDSTSNVDAPTDSTSNVDAPTVNPASATEDQQASVSEKSSSVEST